MIDWIAVKKSSEDVSSVIEEMARRHYPAKGSHGWSHIQDVLGRARQMTSLSGEKWTPEHDAAVMYHDTGLYPDGPDKDEEREGHEMRSADIAGKELAGLFSAEQLERIATAIRQHRASYGGDLSNSLSDLLSSADRNPPDVLASLRRGDEWNREHGVSGRAGYERIASFMKGKYGKGGYARIPANYENLYKEKLEKFRNTMSGLTPETVERILKDGTVKTSSDVDGRTLADRLGKNKVWMPTNDPSKP